MKILSAKLVTIPFLALLLGCKGKTEKNKSEVTIHIKGSDTEYLMVKHLAEAYMQEHPEVFIDVEGGGSNKGLSALSDDQTDICNSSREFSKEELQALSAGNRTPFPIMFAVDALAVITNYKIGVDSLSTQQVSKLFKGEIKNWKELGGDSLPVKLYGRDRSSGTRDYFVNKFLSGSTLSQITECPSNQAILDSVVMHPGSAGYVGAGFLHDENGKPNGKIWAMAVYIDNHPAYSPYQKAAVKKGDYLLTRPLYQYLKERPSPAVQDFIMFELTKRGQEIIIQHGFFPINDYQKEINRLKGVVY